jgi:hypothetical protein
MSKIHKLTDRQFLRETWEHVFVSDDPFGWPFAERIEAGLIFYPTEGYHLGKSQYEAMIVSAKSVGDDGFIVSITEGVGNIIERGEHWWCEFPPYDEYLGLPLVLENSLYSRNAAWGVMISHEDHGILGGEEKFVATLRKAYPQWQEDIMKVTETWKDNPNGSWVVDLLSKRAGFQ